MELAALLPRSTLTSLTAPVDFQLFTEVPTACAPTANFFRAAVVAFAHARMPNICCRR